MTATSKAGYAVQLKDGRKGRTYHSKKLVNDKVPVYLETKPGVYSDKGILVRPANLTIVGFVD